MKRDALGRREFLTVTAAAPVGWRANAAAAGRYDPSARFDLSVTEVEFRRNAAGRRLMARVYQPIGQPVGAGAFPTVLDLHGGAWNAKDRHAEEPMDRAIASSGVL